MLSRCSPNEENLQCKKVFMRRMWFLSWCERYVVRVACNFRRNLCCRMLYRDQQCKINFAHVSQGIYFSVSKTPFPLIKCALHRSIDEMIKQDETIKQGTRYDTYLVSFERTIIFWFFSVVWTSSTWYFIKQLSTCFTQVDFSSNEKRPQTLTNKAAPL